MRPPEPPNLRLILAIGLASGLTWAVCKAIGLSSAAPYGVVIAALLIRPDFQPWPAKLMAALPLVVIIGLGLGATNPKYLYFGVVLLLNDSLGATLARVRDRMVGVSLGVLMPWLVVNTMPINSVTVGVVMAGTATLLPALGLASQLRTALISSAVTFMGYGVLTDWYIPTRWIDYLLGCALALLVCLLVRPSSALRRLQREARPGEKLPPALRALLPSALEEARVLGQERAFQELLERLKPQLPAP